ncbi:hypothetical protein M5K25_014179 [Dendrobium thyrsiflorum]|uniref:Uncharacterized protein n=1 Tax=Dendrobium thyrsiflorum TaxID=117978 RepID=A0ABD0UVI1_DENTH
MQLVLSLRLPTSPVISRCSNSFSWTRLLAHGDFSISLIEEDPSAYTGILGCFGIPRKRDISFF